MQHPSSIGIVLACDHPIARHGLRSLLQSTPDFEVLDEAADILETHRSPARTVAF